MKITSVTSPADIKQATTNNTEARAKAIAAFDKTPGITTPPPPPTAQEHPVADANNISPEELSAIQPPKAAESLDNTTPTEETTTPEAPKLEAKSDKEIEAEKKFAEIARQERILRAKVQKQDTELKARQASLDAQQAALEKRSQELEQGYISKDKFKLDPISALTDAELTYDELTQRILTQQPRDPRVDAEIKALRDELKAVRSSNEEAQKAAKTQQSEQYQAAVRQIERDAQALVKSNPDVYEAVDKTGSIKDVVELIERTYREDGRLLSVEEAAKEVEDYLIEEGLNTFSKITKIQKRLAEKSASTAPAKPVETQTQAKTQQTQPQMKTLTNAAASTRKLSSRERALLAFKGELK